MVKYDPLHERLLRGDAAVEMSFDEMADLVGGLPQTALTTRQWWGNDPSHVQARAWLGAGRTVEAVDLARRRVRFSRSAP